MTENIVILSGKNPSKEGIGKELSYEEMLLYAAWKIIKTGEDNP